jgi:ATP phosphoribosyltransferase
VSLTIALPKGKLLHPSEVLLRKAGVPAPNGESRKLVVEEGAFRFLLVKDMDVPVYVEYGVADCGIAGRDVLLESGSDVYEPLDLGFGRCRLMVAQPVEARATRTGVPVRVASKYPKVATRYFLERGYPVEVVTLNGSVELAAALGLADCIVDVVETGRTLSENGLEAVAEVAPSSARFIVNRASWHARRDEVSSLLEALRRALGEAP